VVGWRWRESLWASSAASAETRCAGTRRSVLSQQGFARNSRGRAKVPIARARGRGRDRLARSSFKPGDIFRIPNGRREVQLVEGGAPAKEELFPQEWIGEEIDDGATDNQVLLDLPQLRPWDDIAPGDDVHHRDHSSRSGSRRTMTCHRSFRSLGFGDKSGSAACDRSSSIHGSGGVLGMASCNACTRSA